MTTEFEFKSRLEREGFMLPRRFIMNSPEDFTGNFPAVLKVSSETITHKTEAGAVLSDLRNMEELKSAFSKLTSKFPGEKLYAEEMAPKGIEVMVGLIKDPSFGDLILFGLGGFYAELFKDVSFKKLPLTNFDAEDMIDELKFSSIFKGYRRLSAEREMIVNLLLKISDFAGRLRYNQVDFNPVFLYKNSYMIVDAKIIPLTKERKA
ncbi:MAG: acetate--CoA ligase family protein [Thermoplasmatales archaeon]